MTFSTPLLIALGLLFVLAVGLSARAFRKRHRARRAEAEKKRMAEDTAKRHAQVIADSRKIIQTSKNPETIAARFDIIRDHAEKIGALAEHYDLPDIPPESTPQEIKAFYKDEKDRTLRDRTIEQIDEALVKAAEIPKRSGKITYLEKALILALEGKRAVRDEAIVREFEARSQEIQGLISRLMEPPKPQ